MSRSRRGWRPGFVRGRGYRDGHDGRSRAAGAGNAARDVRGAGVDVAGAGDRAGRHGAGAARRGAGARAVSGEEVVAFAALNPPRPGPGHEWVTRAAAAAFAAGLGLPLIYGFARQAL